MSANNGSEKFYKNTTTSGKQIIAVHASVGYVYISCTGLSSRLSVILYLLDWGGGVGGGGALREKFGCKSVDENGDGLNV